LLEKNSPGLSLHSAKEFGVIPFEEHSFANNRRNWCGDVDRQQQSRVHDGTPEKNF